MSIRQMHVLQIGTIVMLHILLNVVKKNAILIGMGLLLILVFRRQCRPVLQIGFCRATVFYYLRLSFAFDHAANAG